MKTPPPLHHNTPVSWYDNPGLTDYDDALLWMKARVDAVAKSDAPECVFTLQHAPLYTAGTSANMSDLIDPNRFPVHKIGRGGQFTYHGPGQRVAYVMLDLRKRGRDVAAFVRTLEQWIIETLATFDVVAERRCGRVGVWVMRPDGREEKIAAIGIRLKRWVSFHGISINVDPDLSHFGGIVPCGISDHGVTSLRALGSNATIGDVDKAMRARFTALFGPIHDAGPIAGP